MYRIGIIEQDVMRKDSPKDVGGKYIIYFVVRGLVEWDALRYRVDRKYLLDSEYQTAKEALIAAEAHATKTLQDTKLSIEITINYLIVGENICVPLTKRGRLYKHNEMWLTNAMSTKEEYLFLLNCPLCGGGLEDDGES